MPTFGTYNPSGQSQYSGYPEKRAGVEFHSYPGARLVPDPNSNHSTYNNSVHASPYARQHQQVPLPLPVLHNAKDFPPLPPIPEPANDPPFADPDPNASIQLGSQESDSSMTFHTLNFPVPPTPHTVSSHYNVDSNAHNVKAEHWASMPPLSPLPEDMIYTKRMRDNVQSPYGREDAYSGIS